MKQTLVALSLTLAVTSVTLAHAQDSFELKGRRAGKSKIQKKGIAGLFSKKATDLTNPFLTDGQELEAAFSEASADVKPIKPGTVITCKRIAYNSVTNKQDLDKYTVFSVGIVDGKQALFELSDSSFSNGTTPYFVMQKTASGILAIDTDKVTKDTSGWLIRQGQNGRLYIDSVEFDEDNAKTFAVDVNTPDALIDPNDGAYDEQASVCVTKL